MVDVLEGEGRQLCFSVITHTGMQAITPYSGAKAYLPFEPLLYLWMQKQKVLVVMEAELWYLLFYLAKRKGTKTVLINARMSDRSFARYKRFSRIYKELFGHVDKVFAQTPKDKKRLEALGAKEVEVVGNIKLATLAKPTYALSKPNAFVVCAASTHEGEESLIVEAFLKLKAQRGDAKLLLVPRHPERFEKVVKEAVVLAPKLRVAPYSKDAQMQSDIVIIDKMGLLVGVYAISDLVIMGGTFEPIGGHNVAEAAQFGVPIISGPHYFNQRDLYRHIEGIEVVSSESLGGRLSEGKPFRNTKILQTVELLPILEYIRKVDG